MLVGAAALFSTGGAALKAVSLTGWQVASFRSAIASVALLAALPETRRGWRWSIVPVASAYAATLVLFVLSNRLTTAADAIFLQSTAPLYLLLLAPLLLHEQIRAGDVVYMALVLGGILLFFLGTEKAVATAPDPRQGNILALASGITYALMLAGFRRLSLRGQGSSTLAATALGNLIAAGAVLPLALPVAHIGGRDLAVLGYLGIVQIGVAYALLTRGIRHVPAVEATTLLMVEPALNPMWAWMVHGERPTPWALAGGATILGATLVNTWRHARMER